MYSQCMIKKFRILFFFWFQLIISIIFDFHFTAENENLRLQEAKLDKNIAKLLQTCDDLKNNEYICEICNTE